MPERLQLQHCGPPSMASAAPPNPTQRVITSTSAVSHAVLNPLASWQASCHELNLSACTWAARAQAASSNACEIVAFQVECMIILSSIALSMIDDVRPLAPSP